jgi:hypothetical protein
VGRLERESRADDLQDEEYLRIEILNPAASALAWPNSMMITYTNPRGLRYCPKIRDSGQERWTARAGGSAQEPVRVMSSIPQAEGGRSE